MAQSQPITKIYELKTIGFDLVHKQIGNLAEDFLKVKQAKIELEKVLANTSDLKERAAASEKLNAIHQKQIQLAAQSMKAYQLLSNEYKAAKQNVEELAAEFGVQSKQAQEAAVKLNEVRSQLVAINNLSSGKTAPAQIISTDNLKQLEAERLAAESTGEAISDLEKQEALAASEATAWVNTQVLGKEALEGTAEAVEHVRIPLQQYTGSLEENIRQNLAYKSRLGEINTALKSGTGNTVELKKEQEFLKKASSELNQTISAQVKWMQAAAGSDDQLNAQLGISRNLMRQLSQEEKNSPFGKALQADITSMDVQLKKSDAQLGNHHRQVGNYTSALTNAFSKTFGFIKQAAFLIPGLGIAGIFNILIDVVGNLVSSLFKGSDALNLFASNLHNFNAVMAEANKEAGKEVGSLRLVYEAATNVNRPMAERLKAVSDLQIKFPDYFAQLDKETILNGKAADSYNALTTAIKQAARTRASEGKFGELETELFNIETQREKVRNAAADERRRARLIQDADGTFRAPRGQIETEQLEKRIRLQVPLIDAAIDRREKEALAALDKKAEQVRKEQGFIGRFIKPGTEVPLDQAIARAEKENQSAVQLKALISRIEQEIATLKEGDPKLKELEQQRNSFQKRIDALTKMPRGDRGSTLSGEEKDDLKRLDAQLSAQLSSENIRANAIASIRKLTFDEEKEHLENLQRIRVDDLNKRVALFGKDETLNAQELATKKKFQEQISEVQLETSQKIQDVEKRRFADQEKDLKDVMDKTIQVAKDGNDKIQEDINSSNTQKAQSQVDTDKAILAAEQVYLTGLQKLNADYSKAAIIQAEKAIDASKALLRKGQRELSVSGLKDIDKETDAAIAQLKLKHDKLKEDILKSNASESDKAGKIALLEKAQAVEVQAKSVEKLNEKLGFAKQLYDSGLITLEQYEQIYDALINAQQKLNVSVIALKKNVTDVAGALKLAISNLFNLGEDNDTTKLLGKTISDALATAQNAENAYFDNQKARIDESLKQQQKLIDRQKEQALAVATSQAEKDSIEKQFAAKREAADKVAFEKNKKLQKEQAKINLAMQLSNLAVVAFGPNPLNIATLGTAGAIMYGIQAALAFANYALNVSRINSAQFRYGGIPKRGGEFGGRPHSQGGTPFTYGGNSFEAEKGELAIIRTRDANVNRVMTVRGTQRQIASAANVMGGGINFSPGATRFDYGGNLGANLQAPYFVPSGGEVVEAINNQSMAMLQQADAINARIDRIEVVQVTNSVTKAQTKLVKQSFIGKL